MRFRAIAFSTLLIAVSTGGVKTMAASPDCARWIREYQQELAKRAVLGKKHVVRAMHRVGAVVPKPKPQVARVSIPIHTIRPPKLSPEEMLKRFRVLCGEDLPADAMPVAFVQPDPETALISNPTPASFDDGGARSFAPFSVPGNSGVPSGGGSGSGGSTGGFGGGGFGGGGFGAGGYTGGGITRTTSTGTGTSGTGSTGTTGTGTTGGSTDGGTTGSGTTGTGTGTTGTGTTGTGTTGTGTTGGGTGGTGTTGTGTGTTGGGTTDTGSGGTSPIVSTDPISPVPEPGTFVLLATGLLGIIPLARRRLS